MYIMQNTMSNTDKTEYIIDLHACKYKLKRIERGTNKPFDIKLLSMQIWRSKFNS